MKKLVIMFAAAVALSFAACTETGEQPKVNVDEIVAQLDSTLNAATDSAAIVAVMDSANAKIQELFAAGDTLNATDLGAKFKEVVAKNAEKLSEVLPGMDLNALAEKAIALPAAETAVGEALDAAGEKIGEAGEAVKDAAGEVVDAAKDKAGEAVDAAKDKAGEAIDAAKDKAGEAADAAKDAVKDAAKKL